MKDIAVIGSGISGLTASFLLSQKYKVTLFESNDYLGGHTHTHQIQYDGQAYSIDTGFIVFNKQTYPNFLKLLHMLDIKYQKSEMSFSVYSPSEDYYYSGKNLKGLFTQKKNFINIHHWCLLLQIIKFNKQCLKLYRGNNIPDVSLGRFLQEFNQYDILMRYYILPMVSAIWSSAINDAIKMPLRFFIEFFVNHGLFNLINRPQWYTIKNGSTQYISPMIKKLESCYLNTAVTAIYRENNKWYLLFKDGFHSFDAVVFASHANDTLAIIKNTLPHISQALSYFKYQKNHVVLHHDRRLLPPKRSAIAAWNYLLSDHSQTLPTLTYHMNTLQNINSNTDFCVSMNPKVNIPNYLMLKEISYEHPVYTKDTLKGQQQLKKHNGEENIYFCGAHLGNGFHEDGVNSAIEVAKLLGVQW